MEPNVDSTARYGQTAYGRELAREAPSEVHPPCVYSNEGGQFVIGLPLQDLKGNVPEGKADPVLLQKRARGLAKADLRHPAKVTGCQPV